MKLSPLLQLLLAPTSVSAFLVKSPILGSSAAASVRGRDPQDHVRAISPNNCPISLLATIEGLMNDDDVSRLQKIDSTIRTLRQQLPVLLTKPLTDMTASKAYSKNSKLVVVVSEAVNSSASESSPDQGTQAPRESVDDSDVTATENPASSATATAGTKENDSTETHPEITLCRTRDELVSLSDVIVLGITTARQANSLFTGSQAMLPVVECQMIIDEKLSSLRVPWTANVPLLGGPTAENRFEGLSEFVLDQKTGRITQHRLLSVTWNDREMNGPAIGQALTTIQQTVSNVQKSPLFQLFQPRDSSVFRDLRDGILEQAAATASSQSSSNGDKNYLPDIFFLDSPSFSSKRDSSFIPVDSPRSPKDIGEFPLPGSPEWSEYAAAHSSLSTFCRQTLGGLGSSTRRYAATNPIFDENVELYDVDGELLLQGSDKLERFFQNVAMARANTMGSMEVRNVEVSWKYRTVIVEYTASVISPWKIEGRDKYHLIVDGDAPTITRVDQLDLKIVNFNEKDNTAGVDARWFMRSMIRNFERGQQLGATAGTDLFADFIQRVGIPANGRNEMAQVTSTAIPAILQRRATMPTKPPRHDPVTAAKVYYMMADLHEQASSLLRSENQITPDEDEDTPKFLPPLAEYLRDDVELRGYLGEGLLRGSAVYNRSARLVLSSLRQSIENGSLVLPKPISHRVELAPSGNIRFTLKVTLKSAASIAGLPADMMGVPFTLELVSEYGLTASPPKESDNNSIIAYHQLIESRINGQPTPADVLVRFAKRFLGAPVSDDDNEDKLLQSVKDAVSWLRKMGPGGEKK